jgi:hypothetical protein
MNTSPFQKPLNEPVVPTVTSNGNDANVGSMNVATRFVLGATQTVRSARKKNSGMRMYWRNESDDRLGL